MRVSTYTRSGDPDVLELTDRPVPDPGGEEAGLPPHVFPLPRTAEAHRAVEDGIVGKVLVDVSA